MTKPGEFRVYKKVIIIGFTDLPSRLPTQASQLFSNNVAKLIQHLSRDGKLMLDLEDEITGAITVVYNGKVFWESVKASPSIENPAQPTKPQSAQEQVPEQIPIEKRKNGKLLKMIGWLMVAVLVGLTGFSGSSEFISHVTVFVLACFVGYMVIWNVSPSLHTPLMSVTNAISGIILIGGMIHLSGEHLLMPAIAVLISTINIVGGFLVTHRMLGMFRK